MTLSFSRCFGFIRQLGEDRSGNVAIIFALSAIPLIGMLGLATDYSFELGVKAKLDQAADAAALAAVTQAQSYIGAYTGAGDPTASAIASGQAAGQAQMNANDGRLPSGTLTLTSMTVTRNGPTLTSKVSYTFQMPTFFMAVLGDRTMTVRGTSTSTLTMNTYVNVIVVLDVSSSMGIGATQADQQTVYSATGCAVACHYSGTTTTARNAGATLRIDVAKQSIVKGLQYLQNLPTASNYKVAVYTMSDNFTNAFPLSANISGAITAVNAIDLANDNYDGGTDTTNAMKSIVALTNNGTLPAPGSGTTPALAQGYVMFITDGVQDSDQKVCGGQNCSTQTDQSDPAFTVLSPCTPSSCEYDSSFGVYFESIDPSQCAPVRNLGYNIMTLNIQYLIPPLNLQGGNSSLQNAFSYIQNYLLNSISSNMTACATSASDAYFAVTPSDINTAMTQMFGSIPVASQARLSQ